MVNSEVDIVLTWVDASDLEWQKEKNKYLKEDECLEIAKADCRFQDWNNLQYVFRGIEKYLPWVRKVFLVTCGHYPSFINEECAKLVKIKHSDYIPIQYLPTFNTRTIELNLHRIYDLSENFILFNDDTFPLRKIEKEYYFINDTVCDQAVQTINIPSPTKGNLLYHTNKSNNTRIINKYFDKKSVIASNYDKWFCKDYDVEDLERNENLNYWGKFTGFRDPHVPIALKKSTLKKLWELEQELLEQTCSHRFRDYRDVTMYLVRYWQLCSGDFYPRKTEGKLFYLDEKCMNSAIDYITGQKGRFICLEDEYLSKEYFASASVLLNDAFRELFPNKSQFER